MKTVRQWLKEGLNEEDYKKAEKYDNAKWMVKVDDFEDALNAAFVWAKTQEGDDYWRKIYLNNGSL